MGALFLAVGPFTPIEFFSVPVGGFQVQTIKGFFLVEIKSRPGRLTGNAGVWVWIQEGREHVYDNPLLLANRKARKLIALLRRQKALSDRTLFLEALIFCSAEDLECDLDQHARTGVWLRDREVEGDKPGRQGILHALTKALTPEEVRRFQRIDRSMARKVCRGLEKAGIRRANTYRRVGQYQLGHLLAEEDFYQEWEARHVTLEKIFRRVRIYSASSREKGTREAIIRAARREFQILEGIEHPGILRAENYVEHELGFTRSCWSVSGVICFGRSTIWRSTAFPTGTSSRAIWAWWRPAARASCI
ncbi:MAG: NERD domain-containing protein [Magnetococcales bacterium]|nr:NERD domain-containing protein [Magnetococcales bacterium]